MNSIFVFIGTVITTGIITTILWEVSFKNSKKKLLDKINSLQDGLNIKQQALQKAEIKIISLNSHCNLLEAAVGTKELTIAELTAELNKNVSVPSVDTSTEVVKKKYRGRPKKKQSSNGRSTTNNNKTEKSK